MAQNEFFFSPLSLSPSLVRINARNKVTQSVDERIEIDEKNMLITTQNIDI